MSDKFEFRQQRLAQLVVDESSDYFMPTEDARQAVMEDRDEYTAEGVFWVPPGHRWSDLRKAAKQTDIGQRIDAAMEAIEKENPSLKGVLPKTYARRELTPRDARRADRHLLPRRPRRRRALGPGRAGPGVRVLPGAVRLKRGQERG